MKNAKSFEIDLLRRRNMPLTEQLQQAIASGDISDQYVPLPPKQENENEEDYVLRVRDFASKTQFVNVALFGSTRFVAFGVPGPIFTSYGKFQMVPAQVVGGIWGTHYCLFYPGIEESLSDGSETFLRLDSGCTSGQIFGDTTCDCKEQLDIAFGKCKESGKGIIINIPDHDGRGWGEYKMANQLLMDELNIDTVSAANKFYGNETSVDQRSFDEAVMILLAFGFNGAHKFQLGTNNPRKIGAFNAMGLRIGDVASIISTSMNETTQRNFDAKKSEWGHAGT